MTDTSPEHVAATVSYLRARLLHEPEVADEMAALAAERDAWRELAEARNALMAYHRARSHPPEKVLRRLDLARAALNETGDDTHE